MNKSIGIDLGTTYSVVSFKDTSVKIIRNNEHEELTRSCVGIRNNQFFVGKGAFNILKKDPFNTIVSIKRLMGGSIKDEMVQKMINSNFYKFEIRKFEGGTDDAVAVILGGKQYSPEMISAEILKELKRIAEVKLGEITHAVITVPAYFTEKQKNATRLAAELAGLKVQRLLPEPTAAAISYGVDNLKPGESKTILVYDFGGGTFDLSILNIVDGQFIEAGTGGDRWLGGDDLDRKLKELIFEKVKKQYNIDDINVLVNNLPAKKRYEFEGEVRIQTEIAKIQLSATNSASIIIDNILEDESGDYIDIDVIITRDEFEAAISPYIEKTILLIKNLLIEVHYDLEMIDSILLVGGSSCIPLIKKMLSDVFGVSKIMVSEKPMLAVSEGAAILSHRLDDNYEHSINTDNEVKNILSSTNHKYFVKLKDGFSDAIIEKQEPLPLSVSKVYKTTVLNQKIVKVVIHTDVEGGRINEIPETTGFFTLEEDLPAGSEIVFNISLNIDEVFEIEVYPKNSKNKLKRIVLGRGYKDSRVFDFISSCLEKLSGDGYTEKQREHFMKLIQKEIEKVNTLGTESRDSGKWDEIGTNTFSAFEQTESLKDEDDEFNYAILFATILVKEYSDLINSANVLKMQQLLHIYQTDEDPLSKIQASQNLKSLTDEYSLLITLYTVKLAGINLQKPNPQIANTLFEMHDKIVNYFREERSEEAYELLEKALKFRDNNNSYGTDIYSVYLTNR